MSQSSDITFTIDDAILFFKRNFLIILCTFLCVVTAVTFITFSLDKKYSSTVQLIVQVNKQRAVELNQDNFDKDNLTSLRTQVEVIKSSSVLRNVVKELDIENNASLVSQEMRDELKKLSPEKRRVFFDNVIRNMIDVSLLPGTNIIDIKVTSIDPYIAADIANEVALQYIHYIKAKELQDIKNNNVIIAEQINQLKDEMKKASIALEEYRVQSGILGDAKEDLTKDQLFDISQQVTAVKVQLSEKKARLASAQNALRRGYSASYGSVFDVLNSPVITSLKQQLSTVQQELSLIKTKYKPSHPSYREVASKEQKILNAIHLETKNIVSSLSSEVRTLQNNLASLERSRHEIKTKLLNKKGSVPQLRQYEQHAKITEGIFQLYAQRLEETNLSEKLVQSNVTIITMAQPNIKPVSPNKILNILLGSVAGVIFGLILAMVRDFFNNGIVSTEELGDLFQTHDKFFILSEKNIKNLGRLFLPLSKLSSYSSLCDLAFLIKKKLDDNQKIFSLVSSIPKEGKTTSSLLLSQLLGKANLKVLLIDLDYRKRTLTKRVAPSLEAEALFNASGDEAYIDEMIRVIKAPEGDRAFSFLPIGTEVDNNVWKMLENASFKSDLYKLASYYDVVLVDTAPILAVQETKHFISLTQAIIFIAKWRATPYKTIKVAQKVIQKTCVSTCITVLNQVHSKKSYYYSDKNLDFYLKKYKDY